MSVVGKGVTGKHRWIQLNVLSLAAIDPGSRKAAMMEKRSRQTLVDADKCTLLCGYRFKWQVAEVNVDVGCRTSVVNGG